MRTNYEQKNKNTCKKIGTDKKKKFLTRQLIKKKKKSDEKSQETDRRKRDRKDTFSKESFAVIFKGMEEGMRMLGGILSAPTKYLYIYINEKTYLSGSIDN